jgi:hypothetical protein
MSSMSWSAAAPSASRVHPGTLPAPPASAHCTTLARSLRRACASAAFSTCTVGGRRADTCGGDGAEHGCISSSRRCARLSAAAGSSHPAPSAAPQSNKHPPAPGSAAARLPAAPPGLGCRAAWAPPGRR